MKFNDQKGIAPILLLVAVVGVIAFLAIAGSAPFKTNLLTSIFPKDESQAAFAAPTPIPGCAFGTTVPAGQSNPTAEYEPMGAVWCYPLGPASAPTRIKGQNSWVDDFNTNTQMQKLNNGDMDYTVLDAEGSVYKAQRFINNNHWMTDFSGVSAEPCSASTCGPWDFGGTAMRPNMTFTAENGQLTIEADIASAIPEYEGNLFWPEIVVTTAPKFTGPTSYGAMIRRNGTYVYEMFPNHYTLGCRMQTDGGFTCAMLDKTEEGDTQSRVFELSHFQCGNSADSPHPGSQYGCSNIYGGLPANVPANIKPFKRQCNPNQMDMACRDRFRWEITNNRMTWYVNGAKYMEHTGFAPGGKAMIDNLLNQPVYVYFGEFMYKLGTPARSHWDRLAINPKDEGNHLQPPTVAPSFCLGQPQGSCPMIFTSPETPVPSKTDIDILDFVYGTPNITVKQGDTVTWTNKSTQSIAHSVTSDTGLFDSGIFAAGQKFSYTFNNVGTFDYYCTPHPGMKGKVTVVSANGSPMPSMSMAPSPSAAPSSTPQASVKPGDIDGNNKVDIFDYNTLLSNFGKTGTNLGGDFDKNGKVDIFDFNTLLSNFGK